MGCPLVKNLNVIEESSKVVEEVNSWEERTFPECIWEDFKITIIGEKDDLLVHFCDKCDMPVMPFKINGRIILCKHAFCYDCDSLYPPKRR